MTTLPLLPTNEEKRTLEKLRYLKMEQPGFYRLVMTTLANYHRFAVLEKRLDSYRRNITSIASPEVRQN